MVQASEASTVVRSTPGLFRQATAVALCCQQAAEPGHAGACLW